MSKIPQDALFDPKAHSKAHLTTLSYEFTDKYRIREHFHDTDQLVFASSGVPASSTSSCNSIDCKRRKDYLGRAGSRL
jgi:hypothetical protein